MARPKSEDVQSQVQAAIVLHEKKQKETSDRKRKAQGGWAKLAQLQPRFEAFGGVWGGQPAQAL